MSTLPQQLEAGTFMKPLNCSWTNTPTSTRIQLIRRPYQLIGSFEMQELREAQLESAFICGSEVLFNWSSFNKFPGEVVSKFCKVVSSWGMSDLYCFLLLQVLSCSFCEKIPLALLLWFLSLIKIANILHLCDQISLLISLEFTHIKLEEYNTGF